MNYSALLFGQQFRCLEIRPHSELQVSDATGRFSFRKILLDGSFRLRVALRLSESAPFLECALSVLPQSTESTLSRKRAGTTRTQGTYIEHT